MPKTKLGQQNRKYEKVIALIWGTLDARNISIEEFTKNIDITKSTLYSRKKNPENFTVKELSRIGRYLGIPIEELRQSSIIY